MKLKSTVKYQLFDIEKPVLIFYFVLLCILVFVFVASGAKFAASVNMVSFTSGSGISCLLYTSDAADE